MMSLHRDTRWMGEALALARRGLGHTRPNPPVGAVVVRANRLVGAGFHRRAGTPHAEIHALREAGAAARGAELFVTLEPCSTWGRTGPCTEAILAAGIRRVVVGTTDPNPHHRGRGLAWLRRRGVIVEAGPCEAEAATLLEPFSRWITTQRPFVTLKLAMTLDGHLADATGRSQWITSPESRERVQALRRSADAVLVGVGTALADDPSLTCRIDPEDARWRVVVDSTGRLPLTARVLTDGAVARTVVATTKRCSAKQAERYRGLGAQVWVLPAAHGRVSLPTLLRRLGRAGMLHVLCEGGAVLAGALVSGGLADAYALYVGPKFLGAGVPLLSGVGWPLGRAPTLRVTHCEQVGRDLEILARPAREATDRRKRRTT